MTLWTSGTRGPKNYISQQFTKPPDQASSFFNSRKDMTKIVNITAALIRKVAAPIELYKNPPKVNPTILARPPKLPATPCTAP